MKNINALVLVAALFAGVTNSTNAEAAASVTPVSVAIVPPIQFPSDEFTITGARLSVLWGRHRDLYGLDFGAIGNITTQSFVGVGISGIFNYTEGMTRILALQAAGVANISTQKTQVYGLQVAGGMNWVTAESTVVGVQAALIGNHSPSTNIYGAQIGLYNRAKEVYGLQIGLVNFAKSLHGIQIGLANINETGIFGISPIINIGF